MTVTSVSSTAQLVSAVAHAYPGDTIELAAGVYVMPAINGGHFQGKPVTITSADPANRAVLAGLKVAGSVGLVFSGLELTTVGPSGAPVDPYYAFRISGVQEVTLQGCYVHGDLSKPPSAQVNGFYPLKCVGVSFIGCTFDTLCAAINALNCTGLTVQDNVISRMSKGGLEIGGTSDLLIKHNRFTEFYTAQGVHGDAIQVFTSTQTSPARNITIEDNLIDRGAGYPMQGIFVQDDMKCQPYTDVTIRKNCVLGMQWNSVMLNGAAGVITVEDNIAATWPGPDAVKPLNADGSFQTTGFNAYLRLDNLAPTASLTVSGNQAQQYIRDGHNAPVPAGNVQGGPVSDNGAALLASFLASQPPFLTPAG